MSVVSDISVPSLGKSLRLISVSEDSDIRLELPKTRKRKAASGDGGDGACNIHLEVVVSFEHSLHGTEADLQVQRLVPCAQCPASASSAASVACGDCAGQGQTVRRGKTINVVSKCEQCGGSGSLRERCSDCNGKGVLSREETARVEVPAGVHDGCKLLFPGHGHFSREHGAFGDLVVTCRVRDDGAVRRPRVRRVGNDVFMTLTVDAFDAILGARVTAEGLYGTPFEIELRPGTQSGDMYTVPEEGFRSPRQKEVIGDAVVKVLVSIPQPKSQEEEALWREMQERLRQLARRRVESPDEEKK